MQRETPEGVIIACDFCGTDWDQLQPMIEGHHGSVICLDCFKRALDEADAGEETFRCTLCLQEELPPMLPRWSHPEPSERANAQATVCQDCIVQAAKAFDRDKDVDWKWDRKKG